MHRREFLARMTAKLATAAIVVVSAGSHAVSANADVAPPRPAKRKRPLVAIVADNIGTETTDLMIPHAILTRTGVADVVVVSPLAGSISLMPALSMTSQQTLDAFDAMHPEGADYLIVPAFHGEGDARIIAWIKKQFAGDAFIAGICEGAKVLGKAGLLDGRDATTHWYAIDDLRSAHPTLRWIRDRRYVVDRSVMTTTGVTASIPASLAIVEAIAGAAAARRLAAQLGPGDYSAQHESAGFQLEARHLWRVIANRAAFYLHEEVRILVEPGVDGIALALTADPWSRTYRSQAVLIAQQSEVMSQDGLLLHAQPMQADADKNSKASGLTLTLAGDIPPAAHLERSLGAISQRYGRSTADLVALQLEYAWRDLQGISG